MGDSDGFAQQKLQRRASIKDKVNETVEKSWRSVTTGLGKILETRITNTIVIVLLVIDVCIVIANLLIKLYKREYPEHFNSLNQADNILYWIIFGLRTFYLVMIVVRVCSFGGIYLADPLNLFDAIIVVIASLSYYILNQRDRIVASLFILCRFWRINRVLEFSEQLKKDKHEKNYQSLQRRLTTRLEGERNINAQLRKELEKNDHSLNILMGGDYVTNKDKPITNKSQVKFQDDNKNDEDNNYLSEFQSYFRY
ncbi:hypothetical protein H8356DRAFT_1649461 [Neocallimastix lanati (nom. inval.)]|jgi:ABC-type uncharacterized transport system fused permease/ATPase subunit|uniref:Voltage-gated hydrogen channel 1 n=1 Tax=Neocallimastix californiae TaxID=1754190 RepID=A0A1Y1Z632_9FUNG|nr:hypothetical protein H8356DRAFT_1649461 [Neocallimastix sp. JGI-2020a]ORY05723.1 hypothetical protein LY90DRAFT_709248 [Neocallimastix californiae]|eukprot:ORY05723.1 hypothetical protein LY90DRAFT_709248 [Neocallimastix californiae]